MFNTVANRKKLKYSVLKGIQAPGNHSGTHYRFINYLNKFKKNSNYTKIRLNQK